MTIAAIAAASTVARVNGAELAAAIFDLSQIAPTRTTLPVLSYVLIEAGPDSVTLTACDLDSWLRIRIDADEDPDRHWSLCAPVRALRDIVHDGPVVRLSPRGDRLRVESDGLTATLNGFHADEFPKMPVLPFDDYLEAMEWDMSALGGALERCSECMSYEESRPILNGVFLRAAEGAGKVVSTNGHMLRVESVSVPWCVEAIISRRGVKLLGMFEGTVRVAHEGNHLHIYTDDRQASVRVIEGPYPNWAQVIPDKHVTELQLDRLRFIDAVERVLPIASDQTHRTRLTFTPEYSVIAVETPDLGTAEHPLPVLSFTGEWMTIGFNGVYLRTLLRAAIGETVTLRLLAPERAAVIIDESGATSLVMPLRLLD